MRRGRRSGDSGRAASEPGEVTATGGGAADGTDIVTTGNIDGLRSVTGVTACAERTFGVTE